MALPVALITLVGCNLHCRFCEMLLLLGLQGFLRLAPGTATCQPPAASGGLATTDLVNSWLAFNKQQYLC
jgi:hypothetical protein